MRLIIEDLEGSTTVVNLDSEEVTIGRKPHNTIQLTEQNVSRSHARLNFQDDGWLIHDLGSYNGVKVNGVPISQPTMLRESDLIQIGDYHLTLTDNADRATIDVPRPMAANDGVMMMSSSAELPAASVEDLGPMPAPMAAPPVAHYEAAPSDDNKGNKIGIIIGIVGALLAVIGIGAFVAASQGGDKGGDDKTEDVASKAGTDKTPTPPPEPATTTTGEAVPPADSGGEEPVPEVDSGEEPVPEADSGVEPVPEPEPEPEAEPTKKQQQKQPAKPKMPPEEALAAARKASLSGDNRKAYSLAKDAYSQNQSGDALNLMGVAACKMGSESKAKAAHRKMSSQAKATLEKICGPLGIQL